MIFYLSGMQQNHRKTMREAEKGIEKTFSATGDVENIKKTVGKQPY
jgi:hypothetical protein